MLPADDATSFALPCHLNSRPWPNGYYSPDQAYDAQEDRRS